MGISRIVDWFAGNGLYMNLVHCMGHDHLWIVLTVVLDLTVAAGYAVIAMHWWKNERTLPPVPAKRALGHMRNIFLFCGLCGYAFIPIKMFWPAWRLYDLFMCFLVYFTWRYAWGARDLKVVYNELGRTTRLAEDLKQSRQETAEKAFFLKAISHDLRTPLNGLILQAELAKVSASAGDANALDSAVTEIKASVQAASRLLDTLLDYAQLGSEQAAPASPFDLDEMMRGVVDRLSIRAREKGLSLSLKIPDGLRVCLDRGKLERASVNLLDNAIKFTEHGSIRVEVQSDGAGLEIHVLDTGIGISAEHQEKLFKEFYQIDNTERDRKKGFGLGLAIARRLAQQMGGDVTVESALGRGSRFSIVLPKGVAPAEDGRPAASTSPLVARA